MSSARIPRPAIAAWTLAVVIIAGLVVAVARYLSGTGHMHMHGSAGAALARGGSDAQPTRPLHSALFTAWHLDATAVAVVVIIAALYLTAVALVPVRSPGTRWPLRHTVSFFVGLAVIVFATNGSIAVYDQALFSAHMAGHLALVMVAPALLMWGRPLRLLLSASRPGRRERRARAMRGRTMSLLTAPPVALAVYTVVIVGSHLTGLMDLVMRNTWAGQVEHVVYIVAGCQFFALIVGDEPIRWRLGSPARWLLLAIAMAVDTITGIVLMQQTTPIGLQPAGFAVDAAGDTVTGGAIMWFGGDAIMAVIMVGLVIGWLRNVETADADTGWLEQARSATFATHTGTAADTDIDSDADAHEAYNKWLARLDR